MESFDEPPNTGHAAAALGHLTRALSHLVDEVLASEQPAVVEVGDLRLLVSTAIRLYGGVSSVVRKDVDPLDGDVTQAEALAMAGALLKSQRLGPRDLSGWLAEHNGLHEALPDEARRARRPRVGVAWLEHPVAAIFEDS
ncbi:hypothetical protein [Amycolatopsis sp. GM8]|uniref:hypothetical protein n=1 Tax=Amycolatopsis sp. GM8 TaxID=2896530 RepID=UPI001F41E813|nr:hypothetical protein [Amycolatopsis sp. GM8]